MAESSDRQSLIRSWQLALLAGLLIFAARGALVFHAGSPVPFHDQWVSEGEQILAHDARHTLTWHNFVIPNGDHLVVMTRFIAFAVNRLTGHWDTLAEMLVNNALIAAAFGVLGWQLLRAFPGRRSAAAVLVVSAWLGSPLFYANCLWGFQSGIELLVLTAIVQIVATSTMETFGARWWIAVLAAAIGLISFGGALFAPAVCFVICLVRMRDARLGRSAGIGALGINVAMLAAGIWLALRSPTLGGERPLLANVAHAVLHALSWPAMQPSWFAAVLWLPTLLAGAWIIRSRSNAWLAIYACATWTLLQILAIAITRSVPTAALAPRYYDIFAVGVVANGAMCAVLVVLAKGLAPWRAMAVVFALGWAGCVGVKGWEFARSHTIHDVPAMREIARSQIELVNHYYAGGGIADLSAAEFPVRPHPDAAYLDRVLTDPTIKAALPRILSSPTSSARDRDLSEDPWPGEGGPRRAVWYWSCVGLGAIAAGAFLFVVMRREKISEPD